MRRIALFFIGCMCGFIASAQFAPESTGTYNKGELLVMLRPSCPVAGFVSSLPGLGLKVMKEISPEWNISLISFDSSMDASAAKNTVADDNCVSIVQFNHNHIPLKSTPNDTLFTNQWNMSIISAPQAWGLSTGGKTTDSQQVVVATIDAGFDLNHPDIHYWKNLAEIPGNGIDDDTNGYADDYKGWNSVLGSDSIPPVNHGTFVAGISGQ